MGRSGRLNPRPLPPAFLTSAETGFSKPDPTIFAYAQAAAGCRPAGLASEPVGVAAKLCYVPRTCFLVGRASRIPSPLDVVTSCREIV